MTFSASLLGARACSALALVTALLGAACGASKDYTRLADGTYRVSCDQPLSRCLTKIEDVCKANGYDVLAAREKRMLYGPGDLATQTIKADAHVRCRPVEALFSLSSTPAPAPAPVATEPLPAHAPLPAIGAAPAPTPASGAPTCVPGTSLACAGAAACAGAQVCAPDGRSFGPCNCGPAPASPPTTGGP